jgi:zinc transporter
MPDSALYPALPGLIAGFRCGARGATPLDAAASAAALAAGETGLWLHFDLVDVRAQAFLRDFTRLPEAARAVLLEPDGTVHIDTTDTALLGTFPDFTYDDRDDATDLGMLHFVLTPELLVTARRHPLQALHKTARGTDATSPVSALAAILRCTADELATAQARLGHELGRFEDRLLRDSASVELDQLGAIRRAALRLARLFAPAARLLDELREETPEWLAPQAAPLLRECRRLAAALREVEAVQERGRIAQDTLASAVAEETNRRLVLLSVLSAAILPATLISGIFGMNVGDVPGVDEPWGFAMAMGLILASIALVLGALRFFRLL